MIFLPGETGAQGCVVTCLWSQSELVSIKTVTETWTQDHVVGSLAGQELEGLVSDSQSWVFSSFMEPLSRKLAAVLSDDYEWQVPPSGR